MKVNLSYLWVFCCVWLSCDSEKPLEDFPALMEIPVGFPEMIAPSDNAYSYDRWQLGKKLFYEKGLSRDSSLSCGSCHQVDLAMSDGKKVAEGIENRKGTRNSPSLANIGYHPYLMREGGVNTLEKQVLVPIQEHTEFDFSMPEIVDRFARHEEYQAQSQLAYGRELDAFVITRAIACFERSLISGNSLHDQFFLQGKNVNITDDVKLGRELFFSEKTNCIFCHSGFNFTNYTFENNGLYQTYLDPGKKRATEKDEDEALFKVPSLRNITLTAPYMHDGSIKSLADVIEHYNQGGKNHRHKSTLIKPLNLTEREKFQLIQFLESLTDKKFIQDPKFKQ